MKPCLSISSLFQFPALLLSAVFSLPSEWRSGVAGHLILSDEDLTSVCQGNWKRLNTLQHYKVGLNSAFRCAFISGYFMLVGDTTPIILNPNDYTVILRTCNIWVLRCIHVDLANTFVQIYMG